VSVTDERQEFDGILHFPLDRVRGEGDRAGLSMFHAACYRHVVQIEHAGSALNYDRMLHELHALLRLEPEPFEEPRASTFDWALALAYIEFGIHYCDHMAFDQALVYARAVQALINRMDLRREELALPARPQRQQRVRMLMLLADVMHKAPDEYRDAVLPVSEVLRQYLELAPALLQSARDLGQTPDRIANLRQTLGWAGLHMLMCAVRHQPDAVAAQLDSFEQLQGLRLPLEPSLNPPAHLADSHWYWKYTAFYLALRGQLTPQAQQHVYGRIVATAQASHQYKYRTSERYFHSLARERDHFRLLNASAEAGQRQPSV
jgi:hypothetical protein